MDPIKRICKILKVCKSFAIMGHIKPDADSLASSFAMASLIRRLGPGRKIIVASTTVVPPHIRFMVGKEKIIAPAVVQDCQGLECAIFLECSNKRRAGNIGYENHFRTTVNIDHHKTSRCFADVNWIDPKASSNAEQIYRLYEHLRIKPSVKESTWLYAGMVSDTGCFQYALTSAATHRIAAGFLEAGVKHTEIYNRMFASKNIGHLKLLAKALNGIKFHVSGKLSCMRLSKRDFLRHAPEPADTDDIVNYGLSPESVEATFMFKQEPFRGKGITSVSMRSKGRIDVSEVARAFNGGGHRNAAGFEIKNTSMDSIERMIVKQFKKSIEHGRNSKRK
ncbi:bifunctional oligoribonuclease/PAP phosphatase NrnA [Elusimicrobiota bacterium]